MVVESFMAFLCRIFCFTSYVNNAGSFPQPLPPDEEREYIQRAKNGEADDLISVGSIGLIKGIESFEYGKGSQLATYVAKCIDNEILMYIRANKKHRGVVSLSESVGVDKDGNEITLMELLPAKDDNLFSRVENGILMEKVMSVIGRVLTKRERTIICLRYGLGGAEVHTQLEVADALKISRSYVSRIEKKAVEKIAKELRG